MPQCAVATCRNNWRSANVDVSYHSFPKEKTLTKKWVHFCRRLDNFPPEKSRICSAHFAPEDFERDLRNELLGLPLRQLLKRNAFPSIFSPEQHFRKAELSHNRQETIDKLEKKRLAAECLSSKRSNPSFISSARHSTKAERSRNRQKTIDELEKKWLAECTHNQQETIDELEKKWLTECTALTPPKRQKIKSTENLEIGTTENSSTETHVNNTATHLTQLQEQLKSKDVLIEELFKQKAILQTYAAQASVTIKTQQKTNAKLLRDLQIARCHNKFLRRNTNLVKHSYDFSKLKQQN